MKKLSEQVNSEDPAAAGAPRPRPAIAPARAVPTAAAEPDAPLEGVVLTDAEWRKAARDAAYQATPEAAMFRAFSGG